MENGLLEGEVLYHNLIVKTEEEKLLIAKRREKKKKLKVNRKKTQEENIRRKEVKKEEAKEKSLKGIKKKQSERDILMKKIAKESAELHKNEEDDDAQYYRDEVGEEPDKGLSSYSIYNRHKSKFLFLTFLYFIFQISLMGILRKEKLNQSRLDINSKRQKLIN